MSKSPYLLTLVSCGWDRAAVFFPQLTSSVNKLSVKVVVAVIVVSFINILFVVFSSGFIHVLSLKLNISLNHILRNETKCFCKQSAREYISFLCETLHTYLKLFFCLNRPLACVAGLYRRFFLSATHATDHVYVITEAYHPE